MYRMIYKMTEWLKKSKVGYRIYSVFDEMGLRGLANRISMWYHRKTVLNSKAVEENRAFFDRNRERIDRCCELLTDDESRDVLKSMIQYRCSGNYRDLPRSSFGKQYFGYDFFNYSNGETFVDCGAYDGDTVLRFKRLMRKKGISKYGIVAFEPDENAAKRFISRFPDVKCKPFGVWDKEGEMLIHNTGTGASVVSEKQGGDEIPANTTTINVTSLDSNDDCKDATFIKMDIEGSEYNALLGARDIIENNKPKLAICIYHSNEDMLRLIELVHELNPSYHLYVRQHNNSINETVLYACEPTK